jgi:hypothetical protein
MFALFFCFISRGILKTSRGFIEKMKGF